jgi:hypothetical protein
MLAAAGLAVQLANQELRKLLQGNAPTTSDTSQSSAIARAKHNQDECYKMLYTIQEQADTLCETDIELRIKEEAMKAMPPKKPSSKQYYDENERLRFSHSFQSTSVARLTTN